MKKSRKDSVGLCLLPQLKKYRKDARKYKRLHADAEIRCLIEKRRIKLERLEGDMYASMLEWISDYIFLQDWKDKELMAVIEKFRDFRKKRYKDFLDERQKLRILELTFDGVYMSLNVD